MGVGTKEAEWGSRDLPWGLWKDIQKNAHLKDLARGGAVGKEGNSKQRGPHAKAWRLERASNSGQVGSLREKVGRCDWRGGLGQIRWTLCAY